MDELDALLFWATEEAAKQAEGKPSEWDQKHWAAVDWVAKMVGVTVPVDCGTACCFAGKAVARAGGKFLISPSSGVAFHAELNGRRVNVSDTAREILGITEDQADALFHSGNKLEDLERIVQAIKEGDPRPDYDEDA